MSPTLRSGEDELTKAIQAMKLSLENLDDKFDKKFEELRNSLKKMNTESKTMGKSIALLSSAINDREQHSRNFSIRLSGAKLQEDNKKDAIRTADEVYRTFLKPILSCAVEDGVIKEVPEMFSLVSLPTPFLLERAMTTLLLYPRFLLDSNQGFTGPLSSSIRRPSLIKQDSRMCTSQRT